MRQIRNMVRNRIKNTRGMSIGEVLLSVLIMLLATSVLVTTVSLAVSRYMESLRQSEANTLSSTIQSIMSSELAYTTEIQVDSLGNVTAFQSQSYAVSGALSTFFADDQGKIWVGDATNANTDTKIYRVKLLGDGSYPNHLSVTKLETTYATGTSTFSIHFIISAAGKDYVDQTFQVVNVNRTEPTVA